MVRLGQRDLGLGAGGLGVVRALVVAGGDELGRRAASGGAAGGGRGVGVASRGGDGSYDGLGRENFSLKEF